MGEAGARERVRKPEPLVMNSDLASYRREKDVPGALICLQGDLQATVSLSSSIQLEVVITHQHQLGQVFGDPAANKVQRMHRYDQNSLSVWKIARNMKLATRLKSL